MKSRFDADDMYCNNYLKMHGFAMFRRHGKRKGYSVRDRLVLPFAESYWLRKGRRVKFNKKRFS